MYPNQRGGRSDQRSVHALVTPNMKSFLCARYMHDCVYIYRDYRSRVQPAGFPGFLENPAKTIACGRHGGLFKRPLAISINGARTILDLPTCCWASGNESARSRALLCSPAMSQRDKKVSRSNSRTWRDWHAPVFHCKLIFLYSKR